MSDTSTSESCNATPINHPEYYLPSGDIVIQACPLSSVDGVKLPELHNKVENTLFRVTLTTLHSISPVLQLIVPPTYAGQTRLHGFDDVSPFRLRGVSAHDFAHLLRILIPLYATGPVILLVSLTGTTDLPPRRLRLPQSKTGFPC